MTYIIAVVAQKGGTGKSTAARLIGTKFSGFDNGSWDVVIADMDMSQGTSFNWSKRRIENRIEPPVNVRPFSRVEQALKEADQYHVMIFDCAPHASKETLKIAKAANVVIIPTGLSIDDLEPTVNLANELLQNGVAANNIVFGLCRVGISFVEETDIKPLPTDVGRILHVPFQVLKMGWMPASP